MQAHCGARIRYLSNHPNYLSKHRTVHNIDHNNLPNFIGPYFPKRDDESPSDLFFAFTLLLFKPWRDIHHDLKDPSQTWKEAFEGWYPTISPMFHRMIDNIQYYYDYQRPESSIEPDVSNLTATEIEDSEGTNAANELQQTEQGSRPPSPLSRDALHGKMAVQIADDLEIFSNEINTMSSEFPPSVVRAATQDDISALTQWLKDSETADEEPEQDITSPNTSCDTSPDVIPLDPNQPKDGASFLNKVNTSTSNGNDCQHHVPKEFLKVNQFRAYKIIIWHLEETLANRNPPPLRLIINGEGGTGKSKLIEAVTNYFTSRGASHLLVKMAYTGIAASHIQGLTCHSAAMISRSNKAMSCSTKAKLQAFWAPVLYEIIDEFSMLGKTFFAKLSRNISIGKTGTADLSQDLSFGGTSVIITGDEHQFPPVACTICKALYFPPDPARDSALSLIGRALYEEFSMVVTLREQVRVVDPIWNDFLHHLRHGQVEPRHISILEKLCLTNPLCPCPNFSQPPWSSVVLVTPHHAVRCEWNQYALRKHCMQNDQHLFIAPAEHRTAHRPLNASEKAAMHARSYDVKSNSNDLPNLLELAIGMPVLITHNIRTDLDITNGTRGTITNIILHPMEALPPQSSLIVELQHLPLFVLVKLEHTRAPPFGSENNVIPICPLQSSLRLTLNENSKKVIRTISYKQFPITAAYTLTDYRAQGQSIPAVIIDLAPPPTGSHR